jgi:hypothetical protein
LQDHVEEVEKRRSVLRRAEIELDISKREMTTPAVRDRWRDLRADIADGLEAVEDAFQELELFVKEHIGKLTTASQEADR